MTDTNSTPTLLSPAELKEIESFVKGKLEWVAERSEGDDQMFDFNENFVCYANELRERFDRLLSHSKALEVENAKLEASVRFTATTSFYSGVSAMKSAIVEFWNNRRNIAIMNEDPKNERMASNIMKRCQSVPPPDYTEEQSPTPQKGSPQ